MNRRSLCNRAHSAHKCLVGVFSLALALGASALATPARASGPNLVANGSFEVDGPQWTAGNITGWTKVGGFLFEVLPAGTYGVSGQNGDLVVELSGDWPDPKTRIKQTVTTMPGRTYTLSFLGGARYPGWGTDTINAYWGGALLDSVTPTSSIMQQFSYTVTATGSSMDIEFESGDSDTVGSILDAVSLTADPIDICALYDQTKLHKSGSTVPIKLQVCSGGNNISSSSLVLHAVSVSKIGDAGAGTPEDSGNANPDSDFRYDATLGGYVFNLSTKGLTSGTYVLKFMVVGESQGFSVEFRIK